MFFVSLVFGNRYGNFGLAGLDYRVVGIFNGSGERITLKTFKLNVYGITCVELNGDLAVSIGYKLFSEAYATGTELYAHAHYCVAVLIKHLNGVGYLVVLFLFYFESELGRAGCEYTVVYTGHLFGFYVSVRNRCYHNAYGSSLRKLNTRLAVLIGGCGRVALTVGDYELNALPSSGLYHSAL